MRYITLFYILVYLSSNHLKASENLYQNAYDSLVYLIKYDEFNLKKAVFFIENTYLNNKLNFDIIEKRISQESAKVKLLLNNKLIEYNKKDSVDVLKQAALFKYFTDTIPFIINDSVSYLHLPYHYNFDDPEGEKEWSSTFVTYLMATNKGNCVSLSLYYKILIEELGSKAWLSLAPEHTYIKARNKQNGWYNIELTNGTFPTDAFIMKEADIGLKAIQNSLYMDTLSATQTIAFCLINLAKGYMKKYPDNYDNNFALKCCNTALEYFPHFIDALLLKAHLLRISIQNTQDESQKKELKELLFYIHSLGYKLKDKKIQQEKERV